MKVKFSIKQEVSTEKDGLFSKKDRNRYKLNVLFTPSEKEKKIFNEHPLFHNYSFMTVASYLMGDVNFKERSNKALETTEIKVTDIYNSNSYSFNAYTLDEIFKLRKEILDAGEGYAYYMSILESLESEEEIEFENKK